MARKRGVTRADVLAAAAQIADTEGLPAVTPTAVAHRLGIRTPSLYAHVGGLDGLRQMLALEGAEAMRKVLEEAVAGRSGVDALREIAGAYRGFARSRPGVYLAARKAVAPGKDEELYAALAAAAVPAIRALGEAGVPPAERVHFTRMLRSAFHGFVMLEGSSGFGMRPSVDESFRRLVEVLMEAVELAGRRRGAEMPDQTFPG